ncbi:MAG: hypothetical protein WC796_04670 [Candidatus Pacearchaeota archaeon]|jgi:hypothetical protein
MSTKRGFGVIVVLLLVFFMISFVSADIFLSKQPDQVYNIGSTMSIVLGSDGGIGWANVDLVCANQTKMIYFRYLTDETSIEILAPFTKSFLRGMAGNCHLNLNFNGAPKESFEFFISDQMDVSFSIGNEAFLPGDNVNFTGSVKKADKKPAVNGYASIKFTDVNLDTSVSINNDVFGGSFLIPETLAAGKYKITISVYEKDKDDSILNTGSVEGSIEILQKPTSLTVEVPSSIKPGKDLSFKSELFDQTNEKITDKSVDYQLLDFNGTEVSSRLSTLGSNEYFTIEKNAPFGDWKLLSEAEGIKVENVIYVEKNMEATFDLVNGTLIIRNVGNVPYERKVEMRIGNVSKVIPLNLSVGEVFEFGLYSPDQQNSVLISDGEQSANWEGVSLLTGSAVSFGESPNKSGLGIFNRSIFAWIFIIAILGLFTILTSRKILSKNVFVSNKNKSKYAEVKKQPTASLNDPSKGGVVKISSLSNGKSNFDNDTGYADYSMSIDGARQKASLITIKLKNQQELKGSQIDPRNGPTFAGSNNFVNETLKKLVQKIIEDKGRVYKTNDFIIGIIAPSVTKTMDNEAAAIKTARALLEILKSHNSKFSQKIAFGISVNSGDIVAKRENGKMLFAALGSTLISAKKIADVAESEILLSEDVSKKVGTTLKTVVSNKSDKLGVKVYSISPTSNVDSREQNSKFVEDFLKRNNDYKTLRQIRSDQPTSVKPQFSPGLSDKSELDKKPVDSNNQKGFEFF